MTREDVLELVKDLHYMGKAEASMIADLLRDGCNEEEFRDSLADAILDEFIGVAKYAKRQLRDISAAREGGKA